MPENHQKITRGFCEGKTLLFYPKTAEEARFIQRKLFEMGYQWAGQERGIANEAECVARGMVLNGDKLYYAPNSENRQRGLLCNSAQFDKNYLAPEQAFIQEQFNKLAAQMKALTEEVAALRRELQPKRLDKGFVLKPLKPEE